MQFLSKLIDSANNIVLEIFGSSRLSILFFILLVLWLYFFMTIKLEKFLQNVEKLVVYKYDNILYAWSVFYNSHQDILKTNPWLIVFRAIVWSWNPNYIKSGKLIKETIMKIEDKLWTKVISDQEWESLSKLLVKYRVRKFIFALLKFVVLLMIIFLILLFVLSLLK